MGKYKTCKNQKRTKTKQKRRRRKTYRGGLNTENTAILEQLRPKLANPIANLTTMLSKTCRDPTKCLALGQYENQLKRVFKNFNLVYGDWTKLEKVGKGALNLQSAVLKLPFNRNGFSACSVIKLNDGPLADNLFYEYAVGKFFINNYLKKLPTFLETYSLDIIQDNLIRQKIKDARTQTLRPKDIVASIMNADMDALDNALFHHYVKASCSYYNKLCLNVQYFDNFQSLYAAEYYGMYKLDIYSTFYQVYYALCYLGDKYTHYDLHPNNVQLYRAFGREDKYILMRYHTEAGNVIEFKTQYIAKIIDYGRNYFPDGPRIIDAVCAAKEQCGNVCGSQYGYNTINGSKIAPPDEIQKIYWIDPVVPNMSHDLKLVNYYKKHFQDFMHIVYETPDGTPARENSTVKGTVHTIFDFMDIMNELMPALVQKYQNSHEWSHGATLTVYPPSSGKDYDFELISIPTAQAQSTIPRHTGLGSLIDSMKGRNL